MGNFEQIRIGLWIETMIGHFQIMNQFSFSHDDDSAAIRTIHESLRKGINYIDTAPYYGQGRSEDIIGKALENIPRQAYYIATKVGRYESGADGFDFSAARTQQSLEISLNRLQLDYIDVIQIHDIEFAANVDIILNETLPILEKAKKEGKVRFIGVSGYPLEPLKEAITKAPGRFDVKIIILICINENSPTNYPYFC